ncbi:MAG: molybdate transporter family protein [Acidobacteriota bacterium]
MSDRTIRLDRWEIAGSFGDLGTFISVAIPLVTICSLNTTSLLLTSGLVYILSGFYYRIPIPVQPLKVFATIAISSSLPAELIAAGTITIGILLIILTLMSLIAFMEKVFPQPVIGGIQFAVGLILIRAAMKLILKREVVPGGSEASFQVLGLDLPVGIIIAIMCGIVMFLLIKNRFVPSLFIILALGITIGSHYAHGFKISFSPSFAEVPFKLPGWKSFADSFLLLVIPQLPVTLGNSILATRDLSQKLFQERSSRVTVNALSSGLGFSNIVIGLMNGMPVCHGCGGLSAHYSFGARTGWATVFLGSLFVLLGFFFGGAALSILSLIPWAVLGAMLFSVGIFQSLLIRELRGWDFLLAFAIGVGGLIATNLSIPFLVGILVYHLVRLSEPWIKKQRGR